MAIPLVTDNHQVKAADVLNVMRAEAAKRA